MLNSIMRNMIVTIVKEETIYSKYGEIDIKVLQDKNISFEFKSAKNIKNISITDDKIIYVSKNRIIYQIFK